MSLHDAIRAYVAHRQRERERRELVRDLLKDERRLSRREPVVAEIVRPDRGPGDAGATP